MCGARQCLSDQPCTAPSVTKQTCSAPLAGGQSRRRAADLLWKSGKVFQRGKYGCWMACPARREHVQSSRCGSSWGPLGSLSGASWGCLGASLGLLWGLWVPLGDVFGPSWAALTTFGPFGSHLVGLSRPPWGSLGVLLGRLGGFLCRLGGFFWPSRGPLGPS